MISPSTPERASLDRNSDAHVGQLHELINWLDQQRQAQNDALAEKVHAELASTLTALTMRLALITRQIESNATTAGAGAATTTGPAVHCQKATMLLATLSATTRDIQRTLRPFAIESLGLLASLSDYLEHFQQRTGISTALTVRGSVPTWSQADALTLLQIIDHALLNVEQHANAHKVDIDINGTADCTTVTISDNGVGINIARFDPARTHGIRLMQVRAARLQARFDVISPSESVGVSTLEKNPPGCRIVITIPRITSPC